MRRYRAGDLERHYPSLDIEEDFLTVYGFLPRPTWDLLHPRRARALTPLEENVLAFVRATGPVHPRDLVSPFGRERVVNAWGGNSAATTHALDQLHFLGMLRIVRRDAGIRVYAAVSHVHTPLPLGERMHRLTMVFARLLAPVPSRTLQPIVLALSRALEIAEKRPWLHEMIDSGLLAASVVDGLTYLTPARDAPEVRAAGARFLAPFDPIVWDRTRFEHLFGWTYRFEAYTPVHKRVRGYYALPLLWHDRVIGWANVRATPRGALDVEFGYANGEPKGRAFRSAIANECDRMAAFLGLPKGSGNGPSHPV